MQSTNQIIFSPDVKIEKFKVLNAFIYPKNNVIPINVDDLFLEFSSAGITFSFKIDVFIRLKVKNINNKLQFVIKDKSKDLHIKAKEITAGSNSFILNVGVKALMLGFKSRVTTLINEKFPEVVERLVEEVNNNLNVACTDEMFTSFKKSGVCMNVLVYNSIMSESSINIGIKVSARCGKDLFKSPNDIPSFDSDAPIQFTIGKHFMNALCWCTHRSGVMDRTINLDLLPNAKTKLLGLLRKGSYNLVANLSFPEPSTVEIIEDGVAIHFEGKCDVFVDREWVMESDVGASIKVGLDNNSKMTTNIIRKPFARLKKFDEQVYPEKLTIETATTWFEEFVSEFVETEVIKYSADLKISWFEQCGLKSPRVKYHDDGVLLFCDKVDQQVINVD
ncbi:hypothetical protein AKO1_005789 [Acrasis kona]|uniref:Uncharacterized protein n=1 Tax=Acrasis kona TaxID=1008807 RepID=A0AAW2YK74_9EUKA